MLKKLRDKITEEVQQTSLRLPVSVQQSVQQLTQKSATDQWLEAVKDGSQLNLSPFSGAATSPGEHKKDIQTGSLQDELLVDISDIRPAGHNKDLFSIDEDSHEGSPSKSGFQLVDLSDAESLAPADPGRGPGQGQGVAGVTFDPTLIGATSPAHRVRRDSSGSCVSDASGLFPIYEVPGVSFSMPQSDLESSSEWEDGSNTAVVDRLSKDTVYQAYLKMRQRYHKYKGRYSDLARAYKDKEKESEKLRDVLTKTQDKALRKVSELKEQCALEQQAKAHLEQELRSDLEEKDHKITALQTKVSGLQEQCVLQQQAKAHLEEELNTDLEEKEIKIATLLTKVKILQEGLGGDLNNTVAPQNNEHTATHQDEHLTKSQDESDNISSGDTSSGADNVSTAESVSMADNISMADNVSVASHGSASTSVTLNTEAEELIEKLKGDVVKHKSLLARCMDNIRGNKERIALLTQERDIATAQLQDKLKQIDILKEEHLKELDSLRSSMESSALSMAETKKQLFEELQVKEAETERCKQATASLEKQLDEERDRWQEELNIKQQELEEKEVALQELETNSALQDDQEEDAEESVAAMKKEVEAKIHQLEARALELKESRTQLEAQLMEISQVKLQLEVKVQQLMKDKEEFKTKTQLLKSDKEEMEQTIITLKSANAELNCQVTRLTSTTSNLEEQVAELTAKKQQLEEQIVDLETNVLDYQKQVEELGQVSSESFDRAKVASQEIIVLKEANDKLSHSLEVYQNEEVELKSALERKDEEKEGILKEIKVKGKMILELEAKITDLNEKLKFSIEENSRLNEEILCANREKELICEELEKSRSNIEEERNLRTEEIKCVKLENEKIVKELNQTKSEKETANQRLASLQKELEVLKSEKDELNSELTVSKESMVTVNQQALTELSLVREKMDKLNSDWARQMKEKDAINEELSRKVSDLDQSLKLKTDDYKQKTDEYKQKIESLNFQLQQKEDKENEFKTRVVNLLEENGKLCKNITDMKADLQVKESEAKNIENLQKENNELSVRVADLETDVNSREVELTAAVEEKQQLLALLEKIKQEKTKLEDELKAAKIEVIKYKEEMSAAQTDLKNKEEHNIKLKEEVASCAEENRKTKENMERESQSFKTEINNTKESYRQLKENYETFSKEKETLMTEQNQKITELESKNLEHGQQLSELKCRVKEREEKIEKLLIEKKSMLTELGKRVDELQIELNEKESLLNKRTAEFELKVEELEVQMHDSEESLKNELENSFQQKHELEKKVAELSHAILKKDEMMVRQAEDAEQKLKDAHEDFAQKTEELETTWEERLRCELDRLQKQHDENLASASMDANKSQHSQLEAARSSHQRAIATRDATIAALKDELDQQQLSHQEQLDTWSHKYENLLSELAEAKCQSVCQSERLRIIETTMEETSEQLAASAAGHAGLEERLQQATATCEALEAQVETLAINNNQLTLTIEQFEKEKERTTKTIAMLEFNNEHNKNKVLNMELSNKDLQEKIEALWKEKAELMQQLREGSAGIYKQLIKEKEELEQRLAREKDELQEKHKCEETVLQEQLEGLTEIRLGYEKQISQIEENNAAMHSKIGSIQLERDAARSEAAQLMTLKLDLEKKLDDLNKIKENSEQQVAALRGTISNLEEKLDAEENLVQTHKETIHTLQNNILNLQKHVEGLKETSTKLAFDLEGESKLRIETQLQLNQVKQMHRQLDETHNADKAKISKLESENEELLMERTKVFELEAHIAQLESHNNMLKDKLATQPDTLDSPNDNKTNAVEEQSDEKAQPNINEQRNTEGKELMRLKALLKVKEEDICRIRQSLKDVQERLRLAEVISGEVEEQREKVQELEAKLASAEEQHRQQFMTMALEAERRVAAKEQECHQTISSAYDQQDNETSALVRQHRDILREAQEDARDKAAALNTVVQDHQSKLKEKDEELCKFVQQYEEQLASLTAQHESHIKEIEATWKSRAEKMVRQRELQLLEEKDSLTQEWNKERRSPASETAENPEELERLTQVAAAAFRSGTESVELLKKQVAAQRRELEEVKINHGKEIGELKALLELKRRSRGGGGGGSSMRLGVSLEEAAEFEYLKNILYQYMLGKETQTLSKVLCAVVKFDSQQQQEILEHEEQRQNVEQLETEHPTLHPTLLEEERSDPSKTL
nr:golgin subfamily A member 4-like isoform X1 [Procambarus clarkii]